jgi:hypothetical protein
LLIIIPSIVYAVTTKHGDAVITMRDGLPCFSYPQDEQIKKEPYSFGYLSVSKRGPVGTGGWETQITRQDRKGLIEPNSPETCIRYGGPHPGTRDKGHAEPLKMNTPYRVHITVDTKSGPVSERNYSSNFCITRDEKGNKIIVGAQYDTDADKWVCLKPGEIPKKSFWKRLFGN